MASFDSGQTGEELVLKASFISNGVTLLKPCMRFGWQVLVHLDAEQASKSLLAALTNAPVGAEVRADDHIEHVRTISIETQKVKRVFI